MNRRRAAALNCDGGMSLVELLMVATLIPVVIVLALGLLQLTNRVANTTEAQDKANSATRAAIDSFEKDLRQAQEVVEGDGAFQTVLADKVAFYADVDHDGVPELVTYDASAGQLVRTVNEAATAVAPFSFSATPASSRSIAELGTGAGLTGFAYFDNQDPPNELTSLQAARISAVKIRVACSATSGSVEKSSDLTTWVRLRAVNNRIE